MEANFDTAFNEPKEQLGEPWSHHWVTLGEDGQVWLIYVGLDPDAVVVTQGELDMLRFMTKEQKIEVVEHWRKTRKPLGERRYADVNLPYQSYEWD